MAHKTYWINVRKCEKKSRFARANEPIHNQSGCEMYVLSVEFDV